MNGYALAHLTEIDAREHLRRAIELHEPLRELARTDSDLASLRERPAFAELAGQ